MSRFLAAALIVFTPAIAAAQQFSPLQSGLDVGRPVYVVVDAPCTREGCGGEFVEGRVAALTRDTIAVESHGRRFELAASEVRRVERYGDRLWNGLVYGALFGFTGYFVTFSDDCGPSCDSEDYWFLFAASSFYGASIGAGIGVLADALTRGRTVIFDRGARASVAPIIRSGGGGVRVSVRF